MDGKPFPDAFRSLPPPPAHIVQLWLIEAMTGPLGESIWGMHSLSAPWTCSHPWPLAQQWVTRLSLCAGFLEQAAQSWSLHSTPLFSLIHFSLTAADLSCNGRLLVNAAQAA